MGRKKNFNREEVLAKASRAFAAHGFEGCSLDDLVAATGLLRGSLYATFGSKRGIFLAALQLNLAAGENQLSLDLVLVALMELTNRDPEIRELVQQFLTKQENQANLLGNRLLARGAISLENGGNENGK